MGRKSEQKIIKPRILHRAHVTKDLEKIFSTPLFFVVSSMGFGKTTAVRDFLNKKRKVKNIWFTFDEECGGRYLDMGQVLQNGGNDKCPGGKGDV